MIKQQEALGFLYNPAHLQGEIGLHLATFNILNLWGGIEALRPNGLWIYSSPLPSRNSRP